MADKRFSELTSATSVADADILAISQGGLSKQLAASIIKSYAQTDVVLKTSSTGAAFLPAGTTGERPGSPSAGSIRYNSTTGKFEGYGSAWGNIGGGAFIGDTAPANPGSGDLWWNSATGHTFVYYGSAWVDLFGGAEGQYLPLTGGTISGNLAYTGTLTGGTGVINIGSGQFYKDAAGNVGIGTSSPLQALDIGNGNISLSSSGSQKLGIFKSGSAFAFTGPLLYSYDSSGLGIGTGNSPIVFGTNNADRGRIDSSGNWLIGATNSAYATKVMVENNSTSLSPKNFITIQNRGTGTTYTSSYTVGGVLFSAYRDVRNPANIAGVWAVRDSAASGLSSLGNLVFGTSEGSNLDQDGILPTERMRLNSSGALVLAGGNTAASGVGIAFPATQSASSDANTLDDYEEGTWTPVDSSGASLTLSVNGAQYIKIGQMVWLYCYVTYPTTSNALTASIGGLPFTSISGAYPELTVRPSAGVSSGIVAQVNSASTGLTMYAVNTAGGVLNSSLSAQAVLVTGCYRANN